MRRLKRVKPSSKPRNNKGPLDRMLLVVTVALVLIGLLAVADASAPSAAQTFGDRFYFAKQQAFWVVLGLGALVVTANINYKLWNKLAVYIFGASVLLLVFVLIPGIGDSRLGATRWINFGFFSLQPSEILKLTLAIYLAKVAEAKKNISAYFIPIGFVLFLIMLQPDLGTTIVVGAIGLSQVFLAGASIIYFVGASIAGIVGALLLILTSEYRRARLMTYLQIGGDPLVENYHIRQILLALGAGGLWGVGLGQSRQKYLYLPEPANDSIFAVIGEEVGFIGATVLIFLFVFFIIRSISIVKRAPDTFSYILGVGIIVWIGGQTIINMAAMVALVPLTGIPLPFISYGGSSLLMTLFAVGILLNISRYAKSN